MPYLGKHSKAITEGIWNTADQFALVAGDRTFTVNTSDGDTVHQPMVQGSAAMIKFYDPPAGVKAGSKLDEAKVRDRSRGQVACHGS